MLGICRLRQRYRHGVPPSPVTSLVTADKQHRLPYRVEDEQQPNLARSGGAGPQLLEIGQVRPPYAIDQWPPQCRTLLGQSVYRLAYQQQGVTIGFAQVMQPRTNWLNHNDRPRHDTLSRI